MLGGLLLTGGKGQVWARPGGGWWEAELSFGLERGLSHGNNGGLDERAADHCLQDDHELGGQSVD